MNNIKIINIISLIVIFVMFFLVIKTNNSVIELKDVINKQNITMNSLNNQLSNEVNALTNSVSDIWFMNLDKNAFDKIQNWEKENTINCLDEPKISILRSFFTSDRINGPAQYLVYQFKTGDIIFDKNGEVFCYKEPIMEYTPPKVNCSEIC